MIGEGIQETGDRSCRRGEEALPEQARRVRCGILFILEHFGA